MIDIAERSISVFPQSTGQPINQSMAAEELAGLRDELREFTRAENARLNEIKELLSLQNHCWDVSNDLNGEGGSNSKGKEWDSVDFCAILRTRKCDERTYREHDDDRDEGGSICT